jgi:hypothetical protein
MTRRIPSKPCIMLVASHHTEPAVCKHCQKPTDIYMESWVNVDYREELEGRGIEKEYAARLAMAASIRHQQKPGSTPYDGVYLCTYHLLETTRRALNMTDFSQIMPYLQAFTPTTRYIIFDQNEQDEHTAPKLTVGPYQDIWHFFSVYDELGQP